MAKSKEFETAYKAERLRRTKIRKDKRKLKDNSLCPRCKRNKRTNWHSCPYQEDMHADYSKNCRCCSECAHDCAMDI